MKNEHFQSRVRDLANSDEFNVDLFNLIKEKHEELVKTDEDYVKSEEYYFLSEMLSVTPDFQLLTYFRDQVINTPIKPWKRSLWLKMKQSILK